MTNRAGIDISKPRSARGGRFRGLLKVAIGCLLLAPLVVGCADRSLGARQLAVRERQFSWTAKTAFEREVAGIQKLHRAGVFLNKQVMDRATRMPSRLEWASVMMFF